MMDFCFESHLLYVKGIKQKGPDSFAPYLT